MPPFAMAGVRFVVAGSVLYAHARWRGIPSPSLADWRTAWISGALMLLGGNGAVVWAEQWVSSGSAALLVSVVPIWMVVLEWSTGGSRPGTRMGVGVLVGFLGVLLLLGSPEMSGRPQRVGGLAILAGSLAWACGSLYVRRWSSALDARMAAATQMAGGGLCLCAASISVGEIGDIDLGAVSAVAWVSFGYLVVAGSIVAYSAYLWLLRVTSPTRVSTYAYVNPMVAVALGAGFAGEVVTLGGLLAATVIVASVALILTGSTRPGPRAVVPGRPADRG